MPCTKATIEAPQSNDDKNKDGNNDKNKQPGGGSGGGGNNDNKNKQEESPFPWLIGLGVVGAAGYAMSQDKSGGK